MSLLIFSSICLVSLPLIKAYWKRNVEEETTRLSVEYSLRLEALKKKTKMLEPLNNIETEEEEEKEEEDTDKELWESSSYHDEEDEEE